jgi:hypothetical protein
MERNLTVVSYSHILIMETDFLLKGLSFSLYFLASVDFPYPRDEKCVISSPYFRHYNESPCFRCTVYHLPMYRMRFQFSQGAANSFC